MAETNCTCTQCETVFIPVSKRAKYCSVKCKNRAAESRRPYRKTDPRAPRGPFVCEGCRVTYMTTRHRGEGERYCSRACCYSYWTRQELVAREACLLKRIAGNWRDTSVADLVKREIAALKRIARYVERPKVYRAACSKCQKEFVRRKQLRKHATCPDCVRAACRNAQAAHRKTPQGKASKRISKAKRRALERGLDAESIDPIEVFDRDGWKCQICGKETPANLRGSYEHNAPELDHIVALANQGTHTWLNVQCSCRKCNGMKGARYDMQALPQRLGA